MAFVAVIAHSAGTGRTGPPFDWPRDGVMRWRVRPTGGAGRED
ncbi:MAG: hypothetical protein OJF62_000170 [Pseudolabrys sp.]|nr:hypothetical protein [Pseudolabrys sp.]